RHIDSSPLSGRWVSIRLVGLPPGAHVVVDGLPATSPVRLPRGGSHVIEVTAPGYEDRRLEVVANDNQDVDPHMRPAEGTGIRID
ncbi:MAG: PEGA domain-containing protein, partial [Sandaracinaceae bacterium]|nr:PEGA domain-containing protein [Sandaracinaceae bacterium]